MWPYGRTCLRGSSIHNSKYSRHIILPHPHTKPHTHTNTHTHTHTHSSTIPSTCSFTEFLFECNPILSKNGEKHKIPGIVCSGICDFVSQENFLSFQERKQINLTIRQFPGPTFLRSRTDFKDYCSYLCPIRLVAHSGKQFT